MFIAFCWIDSLPLPSTLIRVSKFFLTHKTLLKKQNIWYLPLSALLGPLCGGSQYSPKLK